MKLSMKWLNDYVEYKGDIKKYCDEMTLSGSKVEGYEVLSEDIQNVFVGKIVKIDKHPEADRLQICHVDFGKGETVQIITAATNVFEGAVVPAAVAPATLANDLVIKKTKMRGVESMGMFCSYEELGLTLNDLPGAPEDGILILNDYEYTLGENIKDTLKMNDIVVEFEITSNRPDCLSVIGLARETAATFGTKMKYTAPVVKENNDGDDIKNYLSVEVSSDKCLRYSARVVKNVKIAPSPLWLRMYLRAMGVRPINNIVDITNYVMLEYGQPMHAFDYKCISGQNINVRMANEGEKFVTLDNGEHTLCSTQLLIADAEKGIALAGVMGGLNSEITDSTTTVVFESACFDGATTRNSAKKVGLRTESSSRFEKGLDSENTIPALNRALELVQLLGAGDVVSGLIDVYKNPKIKATVDYSPEKINALLGTSLSEEEMTKILLSLDFVIENGKIIVPTYRDDVRCMNDVAEEVIRIWGYNRIESTPLCASMTEGTFGEEKEFLNKAAEYLCTCGLNEIYTFTFISPSDYDKIHMPEDCHLRNSMRISNPLGEDTSIMRTTAIPSMLQNIARNNNYHSEKIRLFELGKVFIPRDTMPENENKHGFSDVLPEEKTDIVIGLYKSGDFYDIKGIAQGLFEQFDVNNTEYVACGDHFAFHPGRCAKIYTADGKYLGIIGQIHPKVAENYDLDKEIYIAEIDAKALSANKTAVKKYKALPKFPAMTRDIALICDESVLVGDIAKEIKKFGGKMLESVSLFDIFRGKSIPEGKKSVAFSLSLRAADRTLTDEEADKAMKKILFNLEKNMGITLRQ